MKIPRRNVRMTIGLGYAAMIFYLLFLASFRMNSNDVNLVPFRYLIKQIQYVNFHEVESSYYLYVHLVIVANLFLLTPIPLLFSINMSPIRKMALVIFLPVCIEFVQFLFEIGTADIDDFILNAVGFSMGFWWKERVMV